MVVRSPASHDGMSFLSASMATDVHTSGAVTLTVSMRTHGLEIDGSSR